MFFLWFQPGTFKVSDASRLLSFSGSYNLGLALLKGIHVYETFGHFFCNYFLELLKLKFACCFFFRFWWFVDVKSGCQTCTRACITSVFGA